MNMIMGYDKNSADVLISIKPEYVERILSGEKQFEFRKAIFKSKEVKKIFIYASYPIKKIVASFELDKIISGNPKRVWEHCHQYAGVSESAYFDYFDNRDIAFSIKIKNLKTFKSPISPKTHIQDFRPPQSYMYVNQQLQSLLEEHL